MGAFREYVLPQEYSHKLKGNGDHKDINEGWE